MRAIDARYPRPSVLRVRLLLNPKPGPTECLCGRHAPEHVEVYLCYNGRTTQTLLGCGPTVRAALRGVPYLVRAFRKAFRRVVRVTRSQPSEG